MRRSFIQLRRVLFGVSCTVVFGFGATQALADPVQSRLAVCRNNGGTYYIVDWGCPNCPDGTGWCDGVTVSNYCNCFE